MIHTENFLDIAEKTARLSGEYLKNQFGKKHIPNYKSASDIGLEVDKQSEKIIIESISSLCPDHNIFSEEIGLINKSSEYTWYIDPLDGTNNYCVGIAYFGVSISLLYNSEILLGIVFNPITNQLFSAVKGKGAKLNGKKINYSAKKIPLSRSTLSFVKGHTVNSKTELKEVSIELENYLSNKFRRVIKMWAPAVDWCLLAAGGIDVLISFESELEDQYAGTIIAQESGLKVLNFSGSPYQIGDLRLFACNKNLVKNVLELVNDFS